VPPGGERLTRLEDDQLVECRGYDARGWLTSVTHVWAGEACSENATSPLARFRYGHDGRGNRVSEELDGQLVGSGTQRTTYGYDLADRLTGMLEASGMARLYELGGDGSRLGEKEVSSYSGSLGPGAYATATAAEQRYWYDGQGGLEKVTEIPLAAGVPDPEAAFTVATWTVDLAGRVTGETRGTETKEFTWDAGGRLVEAEVTRAVAGGGASTETIGFAYDHTGRRISKTSALGTTRYLWGEDGLVEESLPSGADLVYERAGGLATAVRAYGISGLMVNERLLHDGPGSVVGRVKLDGTAVSYRYDAWGNLRGGGPTASEPSLAYAGQHWDQDVGLSYAQQRWYEPRVGRFLSEDPVSGDLQNPASLHAFGYANGNPLSFTDEDGRRAMEHWEKARDDEQVADYQRRQARWKALPWHAKVADFFRSDGDFQGAKVLARNIRAYRSGIDQAANGEQVVELDVAAEYGEGRVDLALASGTQNLSRNPLAVPASKVGSVRASRARAGATINAVRGGGVATAITAAVTRDDATIQTVAAVETPAMALAASKMVANGVQADLRLKFQVEGPSLQGALPKPVPAPAPPPEPVEYGPFHRLDTAVNVARSKMSGYLGGLPARNTFASDTPEAKAFVGPLPEGASGFEFFTPVPPRRATHPGKALWQDTLPGVRKGTMGEADAAFIPIRITRDSISAPPVDETLNTSGSTNAGAR
jgi:RHS repeat-associated protein